MSSIVDRPLSSSLKPIIYGCQGTALTLEEIAFFKKAKPFGFIIFARNIDTPEQLRQLTKSLRETVGWYCPILIDQEGGRVARMKAPHWPEFRSARQYGDFFLKNFEKGLKAVKLHARVVSGILLNCGIDVNCAPVLDVHHPMVTHEAIGDRAYARDPEIIALLGRYICQTMLEEHVTPVIKHIPGQGLAGVDSHYDLPTVTATPAQLAESDYVPFKSVCKEYYARKLWGMTSHVIYSQIDGQRPATLSRAVIETIIRGEVGLKGLLLSDDLSMKALDSYGGLGERTKLAIEAGIDIGLHCNGEMAEMQDIDAHLDTVGEETWDRITDWLDDRRISNATLEIDSVYQDYAEALDVLMGRGERRDF